MELGRPLHVLDLFSGIGGFTLGLERTGMQTIAFCEINPYCRAVLARHWPNVPIHHDIHQLTAGLLASPEALGFSEGNGCGEGRQGRSDPAGTGQLKPKRPLPIDVICGGFPCQDISSAGRGAGIAGTRSGLWSEFARLIGDLRPRYAIVENVSALRSRGLDRVLSDLAALGYDAEWHCIPASAVGAPHRRDRIWIIAYAQRDIIRKQSIRELGSDDKTIIGDNGAEKYVADAVQSGLSQRETFGGRTREALGGLARHFASVSGQWDVEPDVGRVANGVPSRVDRLKALGNAVVPQVVEIIGRAIKALDNAQAL